MKKQWIVTIISLLTLFAILISSILFMNIKNAGVGELTEPVVIASINSEKSSDGTLADYFSVKQLNENESTDMSLEIDTLNTNQELVNKTFTNLVHIDNSSFGFVMNDKKNGDLMSNIALFYRPVPTKQQYYLALDEDYLLVKASPEKLKALGRVTPTDLRNNILKKQFGLLDFQQIGTAVNGTSLKQNHSASSLITN